MKSIFKIFTIIIVISLSACETYPDWKDHVEYSTTYPVSGEYYVRDYDITTGDVITDTNPYSLYIYNKAFNPTEDSIWVDNRSGHPATGATSYTYKFKIKTRADLNALSFDAVSAGDVSGLNVNPLDSAVTITITNSKVWDMSDDIEDATPDSISFEFTYFDKYGVELERLKVAGHRKTGWEEPQNDDSM